MFGIERLRERINSLASRAEADGRQIDRLLKRVWNLEQGYKQPAHLGGLIHRLELVESSIDRMNAESYSREDIASFGKYLLSEERKKRTSKRLRKEVTHADVENWQFNKTFRVCGKIGV